MKVFPATRLLPGKVAKAVRAIQGPSSWNGMGSLRTHRRVGAVLTLVLFSLAVQSGVTGNALGMIQFTVWTVFAATITITSWYFDRQDAVRILGNSKSAQECADRILSELRTEGIWFDDDLLAESVATVLIQQSIDLVGFVETSVEHSEDGVYHIIGSAQRTSGERVEFMGRLFLWWSGGGRIHCDSLGLIWR